MKEPRVYYKVWVKRGGGFMPTGPDNLGYRYEHVAKNSCRYYEDKGDEWYCEKITVAVERYDIGVEKEKVNEWRYI